MLGVLTDMCAYACVTQICATRTPQSNNTFAKAKKHYIYTIKKNKSKKLHAKELRAFFLCCICCLLSVEWIVSDKNHRKTKQHFHQVEHTHPCTLQKHSPAIVSQSTKWAAATIEHMHHTYTINILQNMLSATNKNATTFFGKEFFSDL